MQQRFFASNCSFEIVSNTWHTVLTRHVSSHFLPFGWYRPCQSVMVSSSEPVLGRSWVPHWHGRFPPQPRDRTVAAWSSCRIPGSIAKRVANSPPVVGDLVWRVARQGRPVNRKEHLLFSIYLSDHSINEWSLLLQMMLVWRFLPLMVVKLQKWQPANDKQKEKKVCYSSDCWVKENGWSLLLQMMFQWRFQPLMVVKLQKWQPANDKQKEKKCVIHLTVGLKRMDGPYCCRWCSGGRFRCWCCWYCDKSGTLQKWKARVNVFQSLNAILLSFRQASLLPPVWVLLKIPLL